MSKPHETLLQSLPKCENGITRFTVKQQYDAYSGFHAIEYRTFGGKNIIVNTSWSSSKDEAESNLSDFKTEFWK